MSASRTCATCIWFDRGAPALASGIRRPEGSNPELGTCNLSPPELVRSAVGAMSLRPETLATAIGCDAHHAVGDPDDGAREDLPASNVVQFDGKAAA